MLAFRPWADLPTELLLLIVHALDDLPFASYGSIRRVCSAWRAVLPSPIPLLISVEIPEAPLTQRIIIRPSEEQIQPQLKQVSALSLAVGRSFWLAAIPVNGRCVGSSNGWMAVQSLPEGLFLLNPLGGEKIPLGHTPVSKVVFSPNATPHDCYVVAICDQRRLAYTKTRNVKWTTVEVAAMVQNDYLVDLAYDADDSGTVYCVTTCGDVHVFDLATTRGNPAVEPLYQGTERASLLFDPAAIYAPPYNTACRVICFKRIFLAGGSLYQVWCNNTCAVSWDMPGGGQFRMEKDEVLVLKYDPGRRPCWHQVRDLGGCSVFIGKNSPAVLGAGDVPGVRPNCVYWIDEWSRNKPMVFDMDTGRSTLHPAASAVSPRSRTVCWYFMNNGTKQNDV